MNRDKRGGTPETPRTAELQAVVDFLDAWRYCPVASSSKPSRSCLENAGAQLLDALDVVRAPVDAERKRLLDLITAVYQRQPRLQENLCNEIEALLREYGRLGKEES